MFGLVLRSFESVYLTVFCIPAMHKAGSWFGSSKTWNSLFFMTGIVMGVRTVPFSLCWGWNPGCEVSDPELYHQLHCECFWALTFLCAVYEEFRKIRTLQEVLISSKHTWHFSFLLYIRIGWIKWKQPLWVWSQSRCLAVAASPF